MSNTDEVQIIFTDLEIVNVIHMADCLTSVTFVIENSRDELESFEWKVAINGVTGRISDDLGLEQCNLCNIHFTYDFDHFFLCNFNGTPKCSICGATNCDGIRRGYYTSRKHECAECKDKQQAIEKDHSTANNDKCNSFAISMVHPNVQFVEIQILMILEEDIVPVENLNVPNVKKVHFFLF